jgi:F-type H+-transporting ATPase subunit b
MLVSLFKLLEGRWKMLNIDWTFIVSLINFLVLLFLLNVILFKPLLKIFKEREDSVKGDLEAARNMTDKREESIASLNRELAESRSKAKEIFESLKNEAVTKQKEVHTAAEAEAASILEKARAEIRAEADKARKALSADVDKFSDEIVRKLVKA